VETSQSTEGLQAEKAWGLKPLSTHRIAMKIHDNTASPRDIMVKKGRPDKVTTASAQTSETTGGYFRRIFKNTQNCSLHGAITRCSVGGWPITPAKR
jgi:hypothetical protein